MKKWWIFVLLGILVLAVVAIIFISGLLFPQCKTEEDCSAKNCFIVQCKDSKCIYSPVTPCCGDGICKNNEDYKSCPEECPVPMLFEGIGHIGHGKLLDSGEIEFKEKDLKHNGFYMANINLPIKFQTKTRDITPRLRCVNKETRILLFSSMEDKTTHYEFSISDHLDYGKAEIQAGENVVLNTGLNRGTKIIEANNGDGAALHIQFDFSRIDSSIILECEASIVAKEPAQSIKIPLSIKYIKS